MFVFGLLFRAIVIDSGVLFGRRFSKTFYFAGVLAVGWDGCNGVLVGALVQALLRFRLFSLRLQTPQVALTHFVSLSSLLST